jgi:hypothetical protein
VETIFGQSFSIVIFGNITRNTFGTHWEVKTISREHSNFFGEIGGNTKTQKNENCLKIKFGIVLKKKPKLPLP